MSVSKKQFIIDVKHEVEMLKKHATKEEIEKLDYVHLDPVHMGKCIYGQMTGSCESDRAKALMDLACVRVYVGDVMIRGKEYKEIQKNMNGPYKGQMWSNDWDNGVKRSYTHLSMIETYICLIGAKNKKLIDYLKGETDTLEL
jgi:hypothetical protein